MALLIAGFAGPLGRAISVSASIADSPAPVPTAQIVPIATDLETTVSLQQYSLTGSDGSTWQDMDQLTPAHLQVTVSGVTGTEVLGANSDLWTANAGYNQDIGIFVSVNGGPDQLVAWKESGGFAGTCSPNAAFIKATYAMTGGHT